MIYTNSITRNPKKKCCSRPEVEGHGCILGWRHPIAGECNRWEYFCSNCIKTWYEYEEIEKIEEIADEFS